MTEDDLVNDQKVAKVAKVASDFECKICDYITSKKFNYEKHLDTAKHKMMTDDDQKVAKVAKVANFKCDCGKSYKYKQGLSVHRKKCNFNDGLNSNVLTQKDENNYKELLLEMVGQTKVLHNIIIEQNKQMAEKNKQISELIPRVGNNNNNTIKQNYNINVFLNENCKDAINMGDFIKNIEISIEDLNFTKDKGLIHGISNLFIENLKKLPLIQRPLWCSDKKRKKLYIKEGEWSEDVNNEKTKQAIKNVSAIQVKNMGKYTKDKPNWMDSDSEKTNYMTMVNKVTENIDGKEEKIIDKLIDTIHFTESNIEKLE